MIASLLIRYTPVAPCGSVEEEMSTTVTISSRRFHIPTFGIVWFTMG